MAPPRKHLPFLENIPETDECVEWPYNGYGLILFRGKSSNASRVSNILHNGEPPFEGAETAHSCHNRGCVNPRHLRWTTHAENMEETRGRSRDLSGPRYKLTEDLVRKIRKDPRTAAEISRELGITYHNIANAKRGVTWRHVV